MKSDMIQIDNQGNGFDKAVAEARKAADFRGLDGKQSLQLQLITEEMLSMARSITGEMKASFWVESDEKSFELNMTTQTVMDKEKRHQLISSSTAKKNAAASGFLGRLRDAFEQAMTADVTHDYEELPVDIQADLVGRYVEDPEWDRYEASILKRVADEVKIFIRGGQVQLKVSKSF